MSSTFLETTVSRSFFVDALLEKLIQYNVVIDKDHVGDILWPGQQDMIPLKIRLDQRLEHTKEVSSKELNGESS